MWMQFAHSAVQCGRCGCSSSTVSALLPAGVAGCGCSSRTVSAQLPAVRRVSSSTESRGWRAWLRWAWCRSQWCDTAQEIVGSQMQPVALRIDRSQPLCLICVNLRFGFGSAKCQITGGLAPASVLVTLWYGALQLWCSASWQSHEQTSVALAVRVRSIRRSSWVPEAFPLLSARAVGWCPAARSMSAALRVRTTIDPLLTYYLSLWA